MEHSLSSSLKAPSFSITEVAVVSSCQEPTMCMKRPQTQVSLVWPLGFAQQGR